MSAVGAAVRAPGRAGRYGSRPCAPVWGPTLPAPPPCR